MRVLLNALGIPSFRQGGAGFYTSTLLDGLARDAGVEVTALGTPLLREELRQLAPLVDVEEALPRRRPRPRVTKAANYALGGLRPTLLDLGFASTPLAPADITHWPISFMHAPGAPGARSVLTVLDLQHEVHPEFFSRGDRLLRRLRWRPSARAADHVVTISQFSADMIAERYGVPHERISVVLLCARAPFLEPAGDARFALPEAVEAAPWFVYPASPLPAKNHLRLLDALARRRATGSEARLVLVGPQMHDWSAVDDAIAARGLEAAVVRLGHVSDEELRDLYARATGLVFPSVFEGFGLPVLEAMAVGCPVASSSAGSLPEVAGDAARTFGPTDVEAMTDALRWLEELTGTDRAAVIDRGHAQAARFSPDAMVRGTIDAYERTLR